MDFTGHVNIDGLMLLLNVREDIVTEIILSFLSRIMKCSGVSVSLLSAISIAFISELRFLGFRRTR